MKPFFIVGLPRSRTAWLANLLTAGPAFCLHDGLRECAHPNELRERMEATGAEIVGDADPALPLFFEAIAQAFPEAQYVFVKRDPVAALASYTELMREHQPAKDCKAAFERLQVRLVEMRHALSGQHVLEVNFADMDKVETCAAIWQHCVPTHPFNVARWRMLHAMRVNVIPEKVKEQIDLAKLKELFKCGPRSAECGILPVKGTAGTELHQRYLATLSEMCGARRDAAEWLVQVLQVALTWDHIRDNDPVDKVVASAAFEAVLLDWPLNVFWREHGATLVPVLSNAIGAWLQSDVQNGFKAYDIYSEIPCAVAMVLGGRNLVGRYGRQIRELTAAIAAEHERLGL